MTGSAGGPPRPSRSRRPSPPPPSSARRSTSRRPRAPAAAPARGSRRNRRRQDRLAATTETAPALSTRPRPHITASAVEREHTGWTSWFTTTDHKKIGLMYLSTVLVFFIIGGVEALLLRTQLAV